MILCRAQSPACEVRRTGGSEPGGPHHCWPPSHRLRAGAGLTTVCCRGQGQPTQSPPGGMQGTPPLQGSPLHSGRGWLPAETPRSMGAWGPTVAVRSPGQPRRGGCARTHPQTGSLRAPVGVAGIRWERAAGGWGCLSWARGGGGEGTAPAFCEQPPACLSSPGTPWPAQSARQLQCPPVPETARRAGERRRGGHSALSAGQAA